MSEKEDYLTKEEVAAILEAAKNDDSPRVLTEKKNEYYLFLRLAVKTGRRLGELLALKPHDIDFETNRMWTNILKTRSSDSRNLTLLDPETAALLREFISEMGIGDKDRIFRSSRRTYQRLPMRYARKAGLDIRIKFHSFRHYVITSLIRQGWSYEDVQKVSGHKWISSVGVYDHTGIEKVETEFRMAMEEL